MSKVSEMISEMSKGWPNELSNERKAVELARAGLRKAEADYASDPALALREKVEQARKKASESPEDTKALDAYTTARANLEASLELRGSRDATAIANAKGELEAAESHLAKRLAGLKRRDSEAASKMIREELVAISKAANEMVAAGKALRSEFCPGQVIHGLIFNVGEHCRHLGYNIPNIYHGDQWGVTSTNLSLKVNTPPKDKTVYYAGKDSYDEGASTEDTNAE